MKAWITILNTKEKSDKKLALTKWSHFTEQRLSQDGRSVPIWKKTDMVKLQTLSDSSANIKSIKMITVDQKMSVCWYISQEVSKKKANIG